MNIYNFLKADHRKVEELFDDILACSSTDERLELFQELSQELLVHADSEHQTLYKTLKKFEETKEIVKHADKEHAEVKEYLATINKISAETDEWIEKIGELKHAVTHHVKEEEEEMFKQARKVLNKDQENQLAQDFEETKQKMLEAM
jgi:hemerythrin superfamily protein